MPEKMFLVEGDRKPDITFAVTTSDGQIVDLSDVTTTATFRYSQVSLSNQEITKSGVIELAKTTDGTDGRLTLVWGEFSLDTPGDYEAEIEIDFDGVKNTTPHLIPYTVRRRLNSEGGPGQPGDNQYQIGIGYLTSDGETYEWRNEQYALALQSINNQTGTSYTLVLDDALKYIRMNNASASTLTVPPNSSVAIAVGSTCHVRQVGAGQVTLVAGSGVTINTPETLKLRKAGAIVSLTKVATDEWDVYGDLEGA
jgi:hypothetical protein